MTYGDAVRLNFRDCCRNRYGFHVRVYDNINMGLFEKLDGKRLTYKGSPPLFNAVVLGEIGIDLKFKLKILPPKL